MTQNFYPCLWYDGQASEAAHFYCSIFKNSKVSFDSPMVVNFELDGRKFMGLNGGPNFKFTEAVSIVVECEDQAEIDNYWESLTADGGEESMCGWLKDKFGMSWQIIPKNLGAMMSNPESAPRVMDRLLKMKKLIIEDLLNA